MQILMKYSRIMVKSHGCMSGLRHSTLINGFDIISESN